MQNGSKHNSINTGGGPIVIKLERDFPLQVEREKKFGVVNSSSEKSADVKFIYKKRHYNNNPPVLQ